jgi:tRNA-dihydrouridine synthase
MVWQVKRAVAVPVIGIGGIANTQDALDFLVAGATAVQVGTATFTRPDAMLRIVEGSTTGSRSRASGTCKTSLAVCAEHAFAHRGVSDRNGQAGSVAP